MKAIICGGMGAAPAGVLELLKNRPDITDLFVYTHKDGAFGPGLQWACEALGIDFTINNINDQPPPFEPDFIVSVYYKHIIKPHIIEFCKRKIFNAHTSLLPRHRGRSAVPWALVEGDTYTGLTWHYIDEGIDTGSILLQMAARIEDFDTQQTLYEKLALIVTGTFPAALALVLNGYKGHPQTGPANYNSQSPPHKGEIDSHWSTSKIERFIRAMTYQGLPPAKFNGADIVTFNDYRRQLFVRWQNERHLNHSY